MWIVMCVNFSQAVNHKLAYAGKREVVVSNLSDITHIVKIKQF